MVDRKEYLSQIGKLFRVHRIVALLGPRQCGKTTLARQFKEKEGGIPKTHYFDLESERDLERLRNPELVFEPLEGLIVIDEVQRLPNLFASLRYIHDQDEKKQFLILGSASRELLRQSSESLAGRIGYIEITPFQATEVSDLNKLWLEGGFPRSYLMNNVEDSFQWRKDYIRTYLEQDIPSLGFSIAPENIRRFWMMLSHYHGQQINQSELGNSLGLSHTTIKNYVDILANTFMVRQLQPWYENIAKRQIKRPKIYFRDSGIYHALLQFSTLEELQLSPKLGASWEGFALEQVISKSKVDREDCYFWGTHNQAELDLLLLKKGKRYGFEFKYRDAPKLTKSMIIAMHDLKLEQLTVIYPGEVKYPLSEKINVIGLKEFLKKGEV